MCVVGFFVVKTRIEMYDASCKLKICEYIAELTMHWREKFTSASTLFGIIEWKRTNVNDKNDNKEKKIWRKIGKEDENERNEKFEA